MALLILYISGKVPFHRTF